MADYVTIRDKDGVACNIAAKDLSGVFHQMVYSVPRPLVLQTSYPAVVAITTGGSGVLAIAANTARQPGSFIQNLSDTPLEFFYGNAITSGQAGILAPEGILKLYEGPWVYQGDVQMFQSSGVSKNIWVVSFE